MNRNEAIQAVRDVCRMKHYAMPEKPRGKRNKPAEHKKRLAWEWKVDLGLAVSALTLRPGMSRSQKELAKFCNTSHQTIAQIERRAVEKIRLALRRRFGIVSTDR